MAEGPGDAGAASDGQPGEIPLALRLSDRDAMADLDRHHLRAVVETAGLMVWQLEPATNLVSVSRNARDVLGFAFPETSADITALIHPDDRAMVQQRFHRLFTGATRYEAEYRFVAPDGRIVWAYSRGVRVGEGAEARIAGITQNITRRKRAEDALRASEHRYRTLFDSIDEGFCIIEMQFDADGAPRDYRFLQVNPAFEGQTGLRDPVGKTVLELVPDLEQHWFDTYGSVATTGEPVRFVHQAQGLDGRWFSVNAFRIDDPSQRHVALLFSDITERRQMERMQEDFIAMVSHDLRSPITALSGRAQLMKRRKVYDEPALDVIIAQAQRVTRLVEDLRTSVSMASGGLGVRRADTDLVALARDAAARLHGIVPDRQVRVDAAVAALVGSWDGDRISQVLDNLLDNATRYVPAGSEIVVRVERAGGDARVSVVDAGPGIPADELPHLFDRFYRAGRDRSSPGMGLGLYISRMLVEAHGGRIWAVSTPGSGSTFTFSLPIET